jgi:hypothetical protein
MSIYATTTEIQSFFKAQWALAGRSESIAYDGYVDESKPFAEGSAPWVRLSYNEAAAGQQTLQNNPIYRVNGFINVQCFQRAKTGTGTAEQMADAVISMFRQFVINGATSGLIRNTPGSTPNALRIGVDPFGWYQINVSIPFIRDARA